MNIKHFLIYYKKNPPKLKNANVYALTRQGEKCINREKERRLTAREERQQTKLRIIKVLKKHALSYEMASRGSRIDFSRFDCVITVGGDGTFLEAARKVKRQLLIGVNCSPSTSVGKLCVATAENFEKILKNILADNIRFHCLNKLRLKVKRSRQSLECLNDVLICHENPAAMSRYILSIDSMQEEQRGSGIWIATSAG